MKLNWNKKGGYIMRNRILSVLMLLSLMMGIVDYANAWCVAGKRKIVVGNKSMAAIWVKKDNAGATYKLEPFRTAEWSACNFDDPKIWVKTSPEDQGQAFGLGVLAGVGTIYRYWNGGTLLKGE